MKIERGLSAQTLLGERSRPTKDVKAEAEAAGLSWATIRRAKDRLGIKAKREGYGINGQWVWVSPLGFSKVLMSTFERD